MTDQPPADAARPVPPHVRPRRTILLSLFAGFAVFAYVFDQLTKLWVTSTMVEGERIPVLPPLLHWYFIRNSGAAFSIGENVTWVFSIIMAAVAVAILFQVRKLGSKWWALALGLLLGGALGNLTDRLFREPSFGMGHVVDFIQLPNVAIICILTLRGISLDGTRLAAHGKDGAGADPDTGTEKGAGHAEAQGTANADSKEKTGND